MLGRSFNLYFKVCSRPSPKLFKINKNFRKQISTNLQLDVSPEDVELSAHTYFPQFAKDLTTRSICQYFPELKMKLIRLIDYPSHVGDKQIARTTLMCYKILETGLLTKENVNLIYFLGWFGEMIHSILYLTSDAINGINIRNNYKTWHNQTDTGLLVANDACFLQCCIISLLTKYFKNHPNYQLLFELVHEIIIESANGQTLELISKDVETFNMDLIERIAKYKVASIYYHLPLLSALYTTGAKDATNLEEAKDIFNDVAVYKEVETDFMDSFGEKPKHLNIQNGYCSWLAVRTLEKANDSHKAVLQENYGKSESDAINKVLSTYNDMNLPLEFGNFKVKKMTDIRNKIEQLQNDRLKECITKVIDHN